MKTTTIKVLVLDDHIDQAGRVGEKLLRVSDHLDVSLTVELSDNAYFAVEEIKKAKRKPRWDVVFADVIMPLPDVFKKRGSPSTVAEQDVKKIGGTQFTTWITGSIQGKECDEHGGFHLVRELRELRKKDSKQTSPHLALISSEMGERRERLAEFLPEESAWVDFFDKDQWIHKGIGDFNNLIFFALSRAVRRTLSRRFPASDAGPLLAKSFVRNSVAMTEMKNQILASIETAPKVLWIVGASGTGKTAIQNWLYDEALLIKNLTGNNMGLSSFTRRK